VPVEVRLYDRLFRVANPAGEKNLDYRELLNAEALEVLPQAFVEPSLAGAAPGRFFQFERLGYFSVDSKDSQSGRFVFNRSVTLRDTWEKQAST
jgi:glutaminyl-tRNA synthetase